MALEIKEKDPLHERISRYLPLILWIGLIFFLSSGQGAMSQTSRIIRPLLELLFPYALPETLDLYHGYIRKFAHPTVYAFLAFWSWRAFRGSSVELLRGNVFTLSLGTVAAIASLDELNQSFISTRTGTIWDVLLDTAGGLAALLLLHLFAARQVKEQEGR